MFQLNNYGKILTFFAHPDDETLAAGATLSKIGRTGAEIHVAIPATGIYSRRNKKEKAALDSDLKQLRRSCYKAMEKLGILFSGGADLAWGIF